MSYWNHHETLRFKFLIPNSSKRTMRGESTREGAETRESRSWASEVEEQRSTLTEAEEKRLRLDSGVKINESGLEFRRDPPDAAGRWILYDDSDGICESYLSTLTVLRVRERKLWWECGFVSAGKFDNVSLTWARKTVESEWERKKDDFFFFFTRFIIKLIYLLGRGRYDFNELYKSWLVFFSIY